MKKPFLFSIPLLALVLMVLSCTKDEKVFFPATQPSLDEAYLMSLENSVVFVVQAKDLTNGKVNGWYINKYGNVNRFESFEAIESQVITPSPIETLEKSATSTLLHLTPEELAPKVRLIKALSHHDLSDVEANPSATVDYRVMALLANDFNPHPNTCSERPGTGTKDEEHAKNIEVFLLKAEGSINQHNQSETASALLDWLMQVQRAAGL